MECMEARALKSSFSKEIAMKNMNPQGIMDDIWCVKGLPTDDFSIDEFFDLPNEENINNNSKDKDKDGGLFIMEKEEDEDEEKDSNCISSCHELVDNSAHFSTLGFPDDDMQELELWSHFMDDSVPDPILACPKPSMDTQYQKSGFNFAKRVEPYAKQSLARASFFPMAIPVKPRSKRARSIGNKSWCTGSPPKTESSSSSPSSPVSTLFFAPAVHDMGMLFTYGKPSATKPKKKPALSVDGNTGLSHPFQRRCSHCQVTKTPQWRAGPDGPKTLCNACGVRYKSGRLFPEYRPACSPTFSSQVHSNSHRKVVEMRLKKEMAEPFNGSATLVSSS